MAFSQYPEQQQGIALLQRSLERRRLAHAYLFSGSRLEDLEVMARTLAKTVNCRRPVKANGVAIDSCDACPACLKIEHGNHADVRWVRPESKTRIIKIEQVRELIEQTNLKPTEAEYKVAVVVAADRLRTEAANAFLKTLEEPPPGSLLILLTTDPERILETITSRCLRLNFGGDGVLRLEPGEAEWLGQFSEMAAASQKSLLGRYRLLDVVLRQLTTVKGQIEEALTARSPLQQYKDADRELTDKWESELAAAVEAEYRRRRSELLLLLQWWLRDVWLQALARTPQAEGNGSLSGGTGQLNFPHLPGSGQVASRITANQALDNLETMERLQRWLGTNAQEALALEVGLLKLRL